MRPFVLAASFFLVSITLARPLLKRDQIPNICDNSGLSTVSSDDLPLDLEKIKSYLCSNSQAQVLSNHNDIAAAKNIAGVEPIVTNMLNRDGGNCVTASSFDATSTNGVNCRDIPHVDEVSCVGGKCFVHACASGFTVSASNDGCIVESYERTVRGISNSLEPVLQALSPTVQGVGQGLQSGAGSLKAGLDNAGAAVNQVANGVADISGAAVAGLGQTVKVTPKAAAKLVDSLKGSGIVGTLTNTVFGAPETDN